MLNPGCRKPFDWGFFVNRSHKMVSLRMAFGFAALKYGYGSTMGPPNIWCNHQVDVMQKKVKSLSPCASNIPATPILRCAGWVPAPAFGILLRLLFEVYAGEKKTGKAENKFFQD